MSAGADEQLGQDGIVGRLVAAPGTAMNEDIDRRVRLRGAEDVELLDLARPIADALGRAENRPRPLAVGEPALDDLGAIGRIDFLVVGVVQGALVHVEPDQRALAFRRRCTRRTLCHACHSIVW